MAKLDDGENDSTPVREPEEIDETGEGDTEGEPEVNDDEGGEEDGDAPLTLDPALVDLVRRADRVGVSTETLQELGTKGARKLVEELERRAPAKSAPKEVPVEEEETWDGYDDKLVKHIKGTKGELEALKYQATELSAKSAIREYVEDQMEDSTNLTPELRTPKHRNAVVNALVALCHEPGNANMTQAQLYKAAEKKALGDKIKAKASAALKPTATVRPSAQAKPQGQYEKTLARVMKGSK